MKTLLCTFSGGRTSAFMARFLQQHPTYGEIKKVFVFANTGKEKEETLEFIHRCDQEWDMGIVWLETKVHLGEKKGSTFKIVDFKTAARKGEPFEEMLSKYLLPSSFISNCTRELKLAPMRSYMKSLGDKKFYTAMGIRHDEAHRRSIEQVRDRLIYPLIDDFKCDEKFIRTWRDAQPFDLQIKDYEGNCDLCFKKSVRKRLTIMKENPAAAVWWQEIEEKYSTETAPRFDMRSLKSVSDLREMAKRPFRRVQDTHEIRKTQGSLFDVDLDYETDCFCKAT